MSNDLIATATVSPEDFASGFARRPGMCLGSPTLERAIGFVLGLGQVVMMSRSADPNVLSPIHEHSHLLLRHEEPMTPDEERAAIAELEPAVAILIAELQGGTR